MALFNIFSTLSIPREERESLRRMALAVEALVAKLNEPERLPEGLVSEADVQQMINAIAEQLGQTNAASAAEFKRIADAHFPPAGSPS